MMQVFTALKPQPDDSMATVLLIIAYIDENPQLNREHIRRHCDLLLQNYPSKVIVTSFAQAAHGYSEACHRLFTATDNLAAHNLRHTDITALTSGLIQNKEAAWKRYNQMRLQVMSARSFQTRPLGQPAPSSTNW